ncbi:hypothetical protein EGT07_24935 [Herbaspirillum sp. HC18]|nr:hypothetical protein EGT07_24935 [Herbaspirillum sp. HC18]
MTPDPCLGCSETPSYASTRCADCGYKFASLPYVRKIERTLEYLRANKIYKLVRMVGLGLSVGALGAAIGGHATVAMGLLIAGVALYITGTVAAWMNDG